MFTNQRSKIEQMLKFISEKANHIRYFIANSENVQLLSRMLFSQVCIACEKESQKVVCDRCIEQIEPLYIDSENSCSICAMPSKAGLHCGECLSNSPHFDSTIACFYYEEPINHIISQYKYHKKLWMVKWLSECLLDAIRNHKLPDMIIPVPLHASRIKQRGYNQAWEIVKRINKTLSCQIAYDILIKAVDKEPQRELTREKRLLSPKGSLTCTKDLTGKTVVVVDDVITTGATLSEAAKVLKKAGAKRIINWVIARAK